MIHLNMEHARTMDRIYRFQRHLYDATRPLFLFGRDALLQAMSVRPGMRVLEMGCGTARNLIKLARTHLEADFYGVDISKEMLRTADGKVAAAGLSDRIRLVESSAEAAHPEQTFGSTQPFDIVFFSYSLSMMPAQAAALDAARRVLKSGGDLYAVDFWDGNGWPAPLKKVMFRWLSLFHVRFDVGLETAILERFPNTEIRPIKGRYAFLAAPRKAAEVELSL
jgi:S-adenosylmethionine-diacylgycerolhomoserine-N-methlytransferase